MQFATVWWSTSRCEFIGEVAATPPLQFCFVDDESFLTSEQVAEAFRVTPQTIRNWIKRGVLPAEKYGHVFRIGPIRRSGLSASA